RVGDIEAVALDPGGHERFVQKAPGGPDKWGARLVLLVTGLFADQYHLRFGRTGAEHRLGGVQVQVAPLTALRGRRQLVEVGGVGNEIRGASGCHAHRVTRLTARKPPRRYLPSEI